MPAPDASGSLYLTGPAGAGKTTRGVARIRALLDAGVPPESILLLTPQRSYARAYEPAFSPAEWYRLEKGTIGGLAKRYVELYWPHVAEGAGFSLDRPPHMLTYEQAQYFMSVVTAPLIARGAFAATRLTRPRLYSQLLDNLNKAAAHGLPIEQLPEYLADVAIGEKGGGITEDVMEAVEAYRAYCRRHCLVDFASYLTLFSAMAGDDTPMRRHLLGAHRHLVVDNLEEDVPAAHGLIAGWLPHFESALLIADTEGSYRLFMGASGATAHRLAEACDRQERMDVVHTAPEGLQRFGGLLVRAIAGTPDDAPWPADVPAGVTVHVDRLHHAMVTRAAATVGQLVAAGVPPGDIAVIAPMLGDNVHYALALHLESMGIASYAHRPSRLLHDEPVTRVMLTFAALAHPSWASPPHPEAVAQLFFRLLGGCDLVRASLLASAVVPSASEGVPLLPFETVEAGLRDRITYQIGEAYEGLRTWVLAYASGDPEPIDHFFSRAFGELLSQPGYGFHRGADTPWQSGAIEAGKQVGALVESAARFRQAAAERDPAAVGRAYRDMVQEGVISAFYAFEWDEPADAVLLAPVHTFLLRNRAVQAQLWLDAGSTAWHRRIDQPLTNPYFLNSEWSPGKAAWDDRRERAHEIQRLQHLVQGLLRRCCAETHVFVSALSPTGRDQKGLLLRALSRAARTAPVTVATDTV